MLADVRSTAVNYALFLHVLGAMILVGALITAVTAQVLSWKRGRGTDAATYARVAFKTLLFVGIPAWVAMRIGAVWVGSEAGWDKVDPSPKWLEIGFITAEGGGLLLLASVILAGFGARRLARADSGPNMMARSASVITIIILGAYLVAVWAMTAKPG
jgi:uncharacterized membrane protein